MSYEDEEKKMATAEVLQLSQPMVGAPPASCMIATLDLWKTYDMGSEQQVHALRGVNLQIRRNEYVAIMAIFVYNTAQRDEMLPRNPLPHPELEDQRTKPLEGIYPTVEKK